MKSHTAKICIFSVFILTLLSHVYGNQTIYADNYPEKFIIFQEQEMPEIKSQGIYNTCWAISTADAINIQLKKQNINYELSPWYLAYSSYTGADKFSENIDFSDPYSLFFKGGSSYIASAVINRWNGMAREHDVGYGTHPDLIEDFNICSSIEKNGKIKPDHIIRYIYNLTPWISEKKQYDTDYIKNFIYNQSAVYTTCSIQEQYYNEKTFSLYCNDKDYKCTKDSAYHSVLLVGWDDNFSKENFSTDPAPLKDGAWLARNSWGDEWGDNGYVWISYEDTSLREAVVYENIVSNDYSGIYQYDEFGWTTSISPHLIMNLCNIKDKSGQAYKPSETGYMANIFRASEDEYISDISFYTIENCEYEISVYTDIRDRSNPISGTLSSVTEGVLNFPGYHMISLDTDSRIKKGSFFSVVVKIKNSSSGYTVPIDACILLSAEYLNSTPSKLIGNINSIILKSRKNESFVSCDGENWADLMLGKNDIQKSIIIHDRQVFPYLSEEEIPVEFYPGNVCTKAFTYLYEPVCGDVNDDGVVTSADISQTILILLGKESETNKRFADIDGNSEITISDLILLKNYILAQSPV